MKPIGEPTRNGEIAFLEPGEIRWMAFVETGMVLPLPDGIPKPAPEEITAEACKFLKSLSPGVLMIFAPLEDPAGQQELIAVRRSDARKTAESIIRCLVQADPGDEIGRKLLDVIQQHSRGDRKRQ